MAILIWDASALVKRYAPEPGSDCVDALFAAASRPQAVATLWGYAEVYSIVLRKRNGGVISNTIFNNAITTLRREVLTNSLFGLLTVDDHALLASLTLMEKHNLNTVDAAILTVFQSFAQTQPAGASCCILIASDKRLLRAADAEGLKTLNPEVIAAGEVEALLAGVA